MAQLFDMQPEIAWSPDSRSVAAMGTFQLQIVDVATGTKTAIQRPNGSGQLSWACAASG